MAGVASQKKMAKEHGEKPDLVFKMVLVGDMGVGKSNLLSRFTRDEFNLETKYTIGVELASKTISAKNGDLIKSQIWDTAGQERYKSITKKYYQGAVGALLVYDISDAETFNSIPTWLGEIRSYADDRSVVLLVGNKSDLRYDREVSEEEGKQFAKEKGLFFIETSALDSSNVNQAFEMVILDVHKLFVSPVQVKNDKIIDLITSQKLKQKKLPKKKFCSI